MAVSGSIGTAAGLFWLAAGLLAIGYRALRWG
ncbi:Uncharacterised protein [Anaerotruncus sp. 2789STDY5834896]|uniref:Uncharacterized protein n=1 Tax=uncultured Anaerotruncus sp. TaxID=905011 RepID=A0A1C6JBP4_9FIRM|nr:Uncharacterised protein [uncultured Anaerotruncus sp.]